MKSSDVRSLFIDFFKKKQHEHVVGSSIVPENDPSLLFINAGMNQFKDVFLDKGTRPYTRAVNSQVCIRVSGKHNDLEDVGKDLTHLTSFEMLGNWSFGDYYKQEAITWAWEFCTTVLGIPKHKLVATVFEKDEESLEIWKTSTDIDSHQIVRCDERDNFWEMGATGPCGPCSEIHVYLKQEDIPKEVDQNMLNAGDFIELWNLVFIQYNRLANGSLEQLPKKHIDTGAGLERLVAFLQSTASNYQTDLFQPIINFIERASGVAYTDGPSGMPHRVMADHIRTLLFSIADNVLPSNEGRGYVLRRLLRRACRYAKQLGFSGPILYKLVPVVVETLGDDFDSLTHQQRHIQAIIKAEEESFLKTLTLGLEILEKTIEIIKSEDKSEIPGDAVFKLYDTFGFPSDLTEVIAQEHKLGIDIQGFSALLNLQRKRSREASAFQDDKKENSEEVSTELFDGLDLHLAENLGVAKGGESKVVHSPEDKVCMAQHHTATHILHETLREILGNHVHQAGSLVDVDKLRFDFTHFEKISDSQLIQIEQKINEWITDEMPISISFEALADAKKKGAMALFGEKYNKERVRVVNIGGKSIELCAGTHVTNTIQVERFKLVSESAIAAGTRRIEAIVGEKCIATFCDKTIENHISQHIEPLVTDLENLLNKHENSHEEKARLFQLIKRVNDIKQYSSLDLKLKGIDELNDIHKQLKKESKTVSKLNYKLEQRQIATIVQHIKQNIVNQSSGIKSLTEIIPNQSIATLRIMADQLIAEHDSLVAVLISSIHDKGVVVIKVGKKIHDTSIHANKLMADITSLFGGGGGGKSHMAQAGGFKIHDLEMIADYAVNQLNKF